jgi:thioredoxin reductase (NADPH)
MGLDVLVVGAGPVGLAAGIEAKRRGLSVLLLDKGSVAHTVYRFPREIAFFSESKNLEIGGHPLVALGPKPTRQEALTYYRKVAEVEELPIETYTEVLAIEGEEGDFRVLARRRGQERVYRARFVVVATGYYDTPNRLGVPGEDLPHVLYRWEEAHPFYGQKVVVVGGSNSAVEAALYLYRAGARVTLVHRGKWVRPSVKYWLLPDFENRVKEGGIGVRMEARVLAITPEAVLLESRGVEERLPADFVLVQIGYRATDGLLRGAEVAYEGERPLLSPHYETSRPGLFAIGSCAFGPDTRSVFIENGRLHAQLALLAIRERA